MSDEGKRLTFEQKVIRFFGMIHPLDQVPRAGYLLRGICRPESVSAHIHFLTLLTMLFTDRYPELFNKEKAIEMALIHDLPEAVMMDIPMPVSDEFLKVQKQNAEYHIMENLFKEFSPKYTALHEELEKKTSSEAKLVSGLDKAQMMLKVLYYEREKRGWLEEFWQNPANFQDYGLKPVSCLFDAICRSSGRKRPV